MRIKAHRQFVYFVGFGGLGFAVDASVLTMLSISGMSVYFSRVISFPLALLTTWYLNRTYTFRGMHATRPHAVGRELLAYSLTQAGGAMINFGGFIIILERFPRLSTYPIIPLAIGAAIALGFNFSVSKLFVFKSKIDQDQDEI